MASIGTDSSTSARLQPLPIDWDAIELEATDLLQRYLRIDTTNPPGGEEAGAQLLAEALRKDGIEPTFYDAGEGRVSISARLEGESNAGTQPLVLLSHIDVVPAEREYWSVDPFAGLLKDGVLWGRGALDMKGMGVMELLVLLLFKRLGLRHRRDLVFLAVADEEEGGARGMGWLERQHPELLRADGVINEGAFGFGELMGHRGLVFGIAPTEKAPLWLRLKTTGRPGHGSMPHRDNAAVRLTEALGRICAAESGVQLRPESEATLATLQDLGVLPKDLHFRDPEVLSNLANFSDLVRAMVTNTVSLTSMNSGAKHNVIPAAAGATLDCRLLPGEDSDGFVRHLQDVIADPAVDIEVVYQFEPLVTDMPAQLVEHIEATIRHETAGGIVMPMISPGFTDSRIYRKHGVPAIGYVPTLITTEEVGGVHGHDERISTANLRLGTQLLLDTVRRIVGETGQPLA